MNITRLGQEFDWSAVVARTTAKSFGMQHCEAEVGVPGDLVGSGSDGEFRWAEGAEGDDGCGGELREPLGDAWAAGPMSVFVPPAILDEEQAVLDLPMGAHRG